MDYSTDQIKKSNKEKYEEFSQEINGKGSKSQFLNKVDTIPVVHNIWLSLLTRYSLIKVSFYEIDVKLFKTLHFEFNVDISRFHYLLLKFQDTHPIVKESLEFGEKTASWAEEKAEYLITVTNLDKPLKKIDNVALNGVVQLENTQNEVNTLFIIFCFR